MCKTKKPMKKKPSIYLVLLSLLFAAVSCGSSDEENYELSSYAFIKSFKIGNIRSAYPEFTSTGKDTLVYKTVSMEKFAFTIDQAAGEIYNNDSLPFSTDVSKVLVTMGVDGVASVYVDSTGTYEHFSITDSLDFTNPLKMRVYSADASYYKDYTARINVHQVNPDMMVWNKYQGADGVEPLRALERDGIMYLFGTKEGAAVVAATETQGVPSWNIQAVSSLPADALGTVQLFGGKFYAVAGGNVYSSSNSVDWECVATGTGAAAIVGVSDADSRIWIAGEKGVQWSADGLSFTVAQELPGGFPLYGVSLASYPLSHNKNIIRYMLAGYTTPAEDGEVAVWSKLSTEDVWTRYNNEGNKYSCPSLKGLAVVRYDNFLYALGGAGVAGGADVDAFNAFYISKDNGIAWKEPAGFLQRLPQELQGDNAPFAVATDAGNYIWIINSGDNGGVWKGILNRLGFKK